MEKEIDRQVRILLSTKFEQYRVPAHQISVPIHFSRYGLSEVVNQLLELDVVQPFDFLVDRELLRVSLGQYMSENSISYENVLPIEYFPLLNKPQIESETNCNDWVSSISSSKTYHTIGCYDGSIRVFDDTDALLSNTRIHSRPIKCIDTFENDKELLVASASLDNSFVFSTFNHSSHKLIKKHVCSGHDSQVMSTRISPSGSLVVSSAWNGSVLVWNVGELSSTQEAVSGAQGNDRDGVDDVQPIKDLTLSSESVGSVCWRGEQVITGGWDHAIRFWDLETGGTVVTMNGTKVVNSMDFYENTGLLASGHPDGHVRIWDSRQEKYMIKSLETTHSFISDVCWCPNNGYYLAASCYDGSVTLFDIRTTLPLHVLEHVHSDKGLSVEWANPSCIFSGGADKKLIRLDTKSIIQ